jgi:hypothetical protein
MVADLRQCRDGIRRALKIYRIDCASTAPTMTERRKAIARIKNAAGRLATNKSRSAAWDLLTALDTPDLDARKLAYGQLTARGHTPLPLKRTLRHWPTAARLPESGAVAAASDLANLDIDALAPVGGRFPDPGLAKLVVSLVSNWETVTGRTARPVSVDKECERKKCPFADWLAEMHDLLGVPRPPVGRVIDIVRGVERSKHKAPATG